MMPQNDPLVILVVDHDVLPRNLLATVLQQQGYTVLAAAHGREAAASSQTYTGGIDLLIADVHLPRLTGFDLCEQLAKERPSTKVLMLAANESDEVTCRTKGLPFVRKPVDPLLVHARVRGL